MPYKPYKYVSHTADIAFIAYGRTFKSALENAALALLNTMLDLKGIKKAKAETGKLNISEKARTKEDLVWFLLQRVLSAIDAKKINAYKLKVKKITETKKGVSVNSSLSYKKIRKDFTMLSVKAVTPHGLEVKKTKTGYSISVVIDV